MDAMKKAFAEVVQRQIAWMAKDERVQHALEAATDGDDAMTFEFQKITDLLCRVRINQGPYKGPRYFDVYVREHI
jgi:hypothetical protein